MIEQISADAETLAKIALARGCACDSPSPASAAYQTVAHLLSDRRRTLGNVPFLTYCEDGVRKDSLSYEDFFELVSRWRDYLKDSLRIGPGSRVATLMVNDVRTVIVYFAAWLAGATVVPINCGEPDERIAYILDNSESAVCLCMPEHTVRLAGVLTGRLSAVRVVPVISTSPPSMRPSDAEAGTPGCNADLSSESEALIVYTSGTTGPPKGVVLDHGNLLADAQAIAEWHRLGAGDRALNVLPIHHVNGIVVTLITPLISGGSVVLNRKFSASSFWRIIAEEKCTWVSVVPTVLAFLCEQAGDPRKQYDLSALRHIVCGAGPLTCELARKFYDRFRVRIVHGYGLSETTCYSCFLPVKQAEDDYRHWMFECGFPSIGCPISANEMAIHDNLGYPVPDEARGEIVIRGQNVMKYYFKRPDANRDTFAYGWFRSGDEGFRRRGADGRDYYFITGRLKELIIRGGVNVSPFDIDEVLCSIPGVKAAMSVGFENDFYGEEIGAYVQLEEGAQTTAEEILRFGQTHLPYGKSPKVVVFGDSFPVTSTGKYRRNMLKQLFAAWKATEFREKRS